MICRFLKLASMTNVESVSWSDALLRCSLAWRHVCRVSDSCDLIVCISVNSRSQLSRCCDIRWRVLPDTTCNKRRKTFYFRISRLRLICLYSDN